MTFDTNVMQLGTIASSSVPMTFRTTEEVLKTHMAIFGGTRQGKSKLFELICRQLIANDRGFAFIDPHSDTADDLLAFLSFHYQELGFLRKQIHYLNPSERLFSFDPFVYRPAPDDPLANTEEHYQYWLAAKIKDVVKIILRKQGETAEEQEKMVRLKTWLRNGLYAVGVRQDQHGTHLPLSDIFVLLNPQHRRHEELYSKVAPFLPEQVAADFEMLRSLKTAKDLQHFTESTFNRLRDILSPLVERIFNQEAPTIDFYEIIRRNGVILASLGKSEVFHEDEALAIAGLIIREISGALRVVPRNERQQFYLLMDEAQNFLGDDLLALLKESGKYKLSVGLAVQALDNLQRREVDLVPAVLGQCGVRVTFQQQYEEHAMTLAKSLCYSMLDFTELLEETDRNDGYDWYLVGSETSGTSDTIGVQLSRGKTASFSDSHSRSFSKSVQVTESVGASDVETEGTSQQKGTQKGRNWSHGDTLGVSAQETVGTASSETESWNRGQAHAKGEGSVTGTSRSHSTSASESYRSTGEKSTHTDGVTEGDSSNQSHSQQETVTDSQGTGGSRQYGESRSRGVSTSGQHSEMSGENQSESQSTSSSKSRARGRTRSVAESSGLSETEQFGTSVSRGITQSAGLSRSQGTSHSVTMQLTPLQRTRVEVRRTGRLTMAISDQYAQFSQQIQSLGRQHCLVAIAPLNTAFVLRVANVVDPFEQANFVEWRSRAIDGMKSRLYEMHDYYLPLQITSRLDDDTETLGRGPQETTGKSDDFR